MAILPPPIRKKFRPLERIEGEKLSPDKIAVTKSIRKVNPEDIQKQIRSLLKYSTFEPPVHFWLDTGSPELNSTLGSRKRGLPYGRIFQLFGPKHGGKTTLATILGGIAQKDSAAVGHVDLENSRDAAWAGRLGLDYSNVLPLYPKLVTVTTKTVKGKKIKLSTPEIRIQSAEEIMNEAETAMELFRKAGFDRQFWLIDSVAMLQPLMVVEAGNSGQNMRTRNERAIMLSQLLPKWAGLAANYNAMVILVNQVRTKQGIVFGSPEYAPGGNTLDHVCHSMVRIGRATGGTLRKGPKIIGILGMIRNDKNKCGEGSVQGERCGFKVKWNRDPALIEFMPGEDVEAVAKGEK